MREPFEIPKQRENSSVHSFQMLIEQLLDIVRLHQSLKRLENLRKAQSPDGNQQGGVMP